MSQQQRGIVTLIAVGTLGVCLVIIVAGFMFALIRLQDGEAGKLLQDTLAQLLWPLVAGLGLLAGIPNIGKIAAPLEGLPDSSSSAPASSDLPLSASQGQVANSAPPAPEVGP